jgi:integrase
LNFKPRGVGQKHYRISLDKHAGKHLNKAEAREFAEEVRIAIRAGAYPPADVTAVMTSAEVTFTAFGALWLERERQGRVKDWQSDRSRLSRLGACALDDSTLGARPIGRITADDLEVAFRQLRVADTTINKYLQTCSDLQRWGVKKGYIARPWYDPKDKDNRPASRAKAKRRGRRLEPDVCNDHGEIVQPGEERRLLAVANPWMQRLIIAALETACRRGELLKLQWKHVDLTRGRFNLPAEITKTAEGRVVVMSARLRAVLEMIRTSPLTGEPHAPTAYVFGNAAGQAVGSPKKAWEVCVLKAHGIKPEWEKKRLTTASRQHLAAIDLNWHDLRHEAGSRWIEAGWPLHHVQQMLGHADLKQTSTYLNATVQGIEESMRRLDEQRGYAGASGTSVLGAAPQLANEAPPVTVN